MSEKTFLVPVVYQMYGRVEVKAEDPEEAIRIAENSISELPLPAEASYLEDSYEVDSDGIVLTEDGEIAN